jgi:uncharacterized protein HemY
MTTLLIVVIIAIVITVFILYFFAISLCKISSLMEQMEEEKDYVRPTDRKN